EFPRTTDDIDAIAATASYTRRALLEEQLRACGFTPDMTASHAGRFKTADGIVFDLSFVGTHTGASGAAVDRLGFESAVRLDGVPTLRHLSGAGFLAMKCAAYRDRGLAAPHASKDLADIAVLLLARPALVADLRTHAETSREWAIARTSSIEILRATP